jgi:putative ABC transport system permease protein
MADNQSMPPADTAQPRAILSSVRPGAGPTAGPEAKTATWLLMVAWAVLLIGCANVVNLALTRALARRQDLAVKRALGIARWRVIAGLVIEAAIISSLAGVLSLALAQGLRTALTPVLRSLRLAEISVFTDIRTLVVTSIVVVISTVITSAIPVLMLRREESGVSLASARSVTSDGRRLRAAMLVTQSALTVVLLVGAGLFVESLVAAHRAPLGYEPERVLLVNRIAPAGGFDATQNLALRRDLLAAAQAMPEVESAAWMSSAPFVSTSSTDLHVPGIENATALGPFTFQATTADYFKTMGTRVIEGRALGASDTTGAPEVAVISQSMARVLWPGTPALGKCFRMRQLDSPCRTVVGIAEDIVQREMAEGPRLHYYVPIDQYPRTFGNGLVLKLRDDPARLSETVRANLQRVLPAGFHLVPQPLARIVDDQRGPWQMGAAILVGFGFVALLVAAVGLFGAVSYDIAQRSREWAIRVALGATRSAVARMVVGRSLLVVCLGIVPGLLIAAGLRRWVQPLLYQTPALDPRAFLAAAVLMAAVAGASSVRPARRAARIDPNRALKE